jgi:hypothetical protein
MALGKLREEDGTMTKPKLKATPTPGPWMIEGDASSYVPITVGVAHDMSGDRVFMPVAYVHDGSVYDDQAMARANASLIAAAPDLLAALEDALSTLDALMHESEPDDLINHSPMTLETRDRLRAAIARARGEV